MRYKKKVVYREYNYKQRRLQLIEAGENPESIRTKIHREYGIHLDLRDLESLIKKIKPRKLRETAKIDCAQIILTRLSEQPEEITLDSLTQYISEKHKVYFSGSALKRIINEELAGKVEIQANSDLCRLRRGEAIKITTKPEPTYSAIDRTLKEIINLAEANRTKITTGISALDLAIKNVLRDNIITYHERVYLEEKAKEYNYSGDIIAEIESATNQNNPYLDDIIEAIYDDGIISPQELVHLKQNAEEIGLLPQFLNERFWTISLGHFPFELVQIIDFIELIGAVQFAFEKCSAIKRTNSFEFILSHLDLYSSSTIEGVLQTALKRILTAIAKNTGKPEDEILTELRSIDYQLTTALQKPVIEQSDLISILLEESQKIGEPASNLLVENVLFRLNNPS